MGVRSENLKKNRKEYLELSGKRCERCLNTIGLQIHHTTYENFNDEEYEDVMILCKSCHQDLHNLIRDLARWASICFAQNVTRLCKEAEFERYGFRSRWLNHKAKDELLDCVDAIALDGKHHFDRGE